MISLISSHVCAQETSAAIKGQIIDPSGLVVVAAKVTATDVERGTEWPTVTNPRGFYSLPRLPTATYTVKAEQPGFQRELESNIALDLDQIVRLRLPSSGRQPYPMNGSC